MTPWHDNATLFSVTKKIQVYEKHEEGTFCPCYSADLRCIREFGTDLCACKATTANCGSAHSSTKSTTRMDR